MELQAIGLAGLEKAQEKLQQTAKRLAATGFPAGASSPADVVDLSAELVALSEAKLLAQANLKVVETANELSSRVINVLA